MLGDGDADAVIAGTVGSAGAGGVTVIDGRARRGREVAGTGALTTARRGVRLTVGAAVRDGRSGHSTAVTDSGVAIRLGAVPMTPLPAGADAGTGPAGDGPSAHPAATANGSPTSTTPMKIDLGESRTD
ncbi:hypothetical protein KRMM14A1259_37670 [Krasilnikovia sp. MM14-A1259]